MAISSALSRNGTRQPQCMNAELVSPMVQFTARKVRLLSTNATPTPSGVNMPYRPRLVAGAYSMPNNADPAHSPPTANPCSSRKVSTIRGAAPPIVAALGVSPHRHSGQAHDQQGRNQRGFAADTVTEMAKNGPTERAGNKGRGKRPHRGDCCHRGAQIREKHGGKRQGRRGAIDIEVVELDGGTDHAGGRDAFWRDPRRRGGGHHGVAA